MSINCTGDGIESTLAKFPNAAKRGGEVNMSEGQASHRQTWRDGRPAKRIDDIDLRLSTLNDQMVPDDENTSVQVYILIMV
ncbi:hypothetical protein DUI87_08184 [Hirundo rustica rustica]|uniref:Uncharacterized protein n=1 Tax=Hirundo rustica rustica TaxID=333673 RepID=A0A3M0L9Q9_HIRRU|nr:hypothetical protein DUI87_08184 [Hirundo rustica rustica]